MITIKPFVMLRGSNRWLAIQRFSFLLILPMFGLLLGCSAPTLGKTGSWQGSNVKCADAVIQGRIIDDSYHEIPSAPNTINMDVMWLLRVQVGKVLYGTGVGPEITVIAVAHARSRKDIDLLFNIRRLKDGNYAWLQSDDDCQRQYIIPNTAEAG